MIIFTHLVGAQKKPASEETALKRRQKGGRGSEGAILHTAQPVVVDGNVVTGRGPGLTIDFALTLVDVLLGKAKRDEIAGQLLVQ